mmetsp:Transcript_51889/g.121025  ORF Transcript_51889/g.121025 Transcript_51889/m.121025 type:complete len:247 (+) Transcript_51889:477-1217(+)
MCMADDRKCLYGIAGGGAGTVIGLTVVVKVLGFIKPLATATAPFRAATETSLTSFSADLVPLASKASVALTTRGRASKVAFSTVLTACSPSSASCLAALSAPVTALETQPPTSKPSRRTDEGDNWASRREDRFEAEEFSRSGKAFVASDGNEDSCCIAASPASSNLAAMRTMSAQGLSMVAATAPYSAACATAPMTSEVSKACVLAFATLSIVLAPAPRSHCVTTTMAKGACTIRTSSWEVEAARR